MSRRLRPALFLIAIAALLLAAVPSALASGKRCASPADAGLKAIRDQAAKVMSAQKTVEYTAYPYMGWRTNGGPWFNNCLDWLAGNLRDFGFVEGKDAAGPHYWFQTDIRSGKIWSPQYASLEIVGPDGDAVAGKDYHFDHILNTFDPTSPYYPSSITYSWLKSHIGTPAEVALNERCHLASSSPFTSVSNTPLASANAAAKVGQLVDVGVVTKDATGKYVWSKNPGVSLAGKFLYAAYDPATGAGTSRGWLFGLANQEGAAGSLSPQINDYNNPVINGKELFPNTVKYAGVTNSSQTGPLAFNISPQDGRYLEQLLASATAPVMMKGMAIGTMEPYSATKPLRTLIAEIPGSCKAAEHVVLLGHLQEPGACDNASGVGTQLELARTWMRLLDKHAVAKPARTITFIWGAETIMGSLWKGQNPDAFEGTRAALVLDMVGEDPAKTGGPMRIEKMPDPSAIYQYGLDTLPGQLPESVDAYVRQPDMHTLWGAGELEWEPYAGHFLNDLYFRSADLVTSISPKFAVGSNPWEGGSDHDTFLWNTDVVGGETVNNPKPAALTWHFTDYVYHTSMDTMGMASGREMRDVALTTIEVGQLVATAGEAQAGQMVRIVDDRAGWRFGWERMNSAGSLQWSYDVAVAAGGTPADIKAAVDAALAQELEILAAWGTWYKEAVCSPAQLLGDKVSRSYKMLEKCALADVQRLQAHAEAKAKWKAWRLLH
jgi:hypothetical protein